MAIRGQILNLEFPLGGIQDLDSSFLEDMSEDALLQCILKNIDQTRRFTARRQILIYFKKLKIHPEKQNLYIQLIKDLVEFEKKQYGVKIE